MKNRTYQRLLISACSILAMAAIGCAERDAVAAGTEAAAPAEAAAGNEAARNQAEGGNAFTSLFKVAPKPVVLPAGTPVSVRTTTAISTNSHQTSDTFTGSLAAPIVVDGVTLAPRGAAVTGVVRSADPGGRVKGRAALSVTVTEIAFNSGMKRVETTAVGRQARSTVKKDAVKVGIGAGVGAAIGAIAGGGKGAAIGSAAGAGAGTAATLATRGEPAVIPAETLLNVELRAPVEVPRS